MSYAAEIPEKWEHFTLEQGLKKRRMSDEYTEWVREVYHTEYLPYFEANVKQTLPWVRKPLLKEFIAYLEKEYKHKISVMALGVILDPEDYLNSSHYRAKQQYLAKNLNTEEVNNTLIYFWPYAESYDELLYMMVCSGAVPEGTKKDSIRARVQHLTRKGVLKDKYLPWNKKS